MGNELKHKLEKLGAEKLTEKERRELLTIFHREEMEYDLKKELYQQLKDLPEEIDDKMSDTEFNRLWKLIEQRKKGTTHKSRRLRVVYWAAAILVVGLLIGNLVQIRERIRKETCYTAVAPKGSVSEFILPDSTAIFLNAGSEIRYVSSGNHQVREVYLNGEAWFDVQKSKTIPFIVHTSFYDVRVMGTQFNVKAYSDDKNVVTTLERGIIQIYSTDKFKMEDDIILKPGQQLVYNKDKKSIHVNSVQAELYSSWKNNKLIFINMSLGEMIALLERKYGIKIKVTDKSILNYHYDGTIRNETILEVLNILQKTLPIDYQINDQEVLIRKQ